MRYRRLALLLWLLAVALLTRFSAFGDGAYSDDEAFYFLVGLRMHDGLLPYVDVWDREGPGLFALYYLITGLSRAFLASPIAACRRRPHAPWPAGDRRPGESLRQVR